MKTVFVSAASSVSGYGILRSLRKSAIPVRLIGSSIYEDSVANEFCDIFIKAPWTVDEGYIDWLVDIINRYKIDLIIPSWDFDVYKWSENIEVLKNTGTKILLNNLNLISLCQDKWKFYQELADKNSPHVIPTSISKDYKKMTEKFGTSLILKPRTGTGSKDIVRIFSKKEFLSYKEDIGSHLIAQPIIGNEEEEYTTGVFCDGKGGFSAHITLKRKLGKLGYTDRASVVEIDTMEETLKNLCGILKPVGPTNFQFREQDGTLYLLEINPRISSTASIRSAFGFNESLMALEYFLEGKIPKQPLIKSGRAVRYVEDYINYE